MNPLNALTTPNETTLLLLGGVALLLINIIYGFIRTTRGHLKAGWFTVILVLVACTLIGVGSVQSAQASSALGAGRGGFNGGSNGGFNSTGNGNGNGNRAAATAPANDTSTDNATPGATATRARGNFGARLTATAAAANGGSNGASSDGTANGGSSTDAATPAATRARGNFGARLTATAAAANGGSSDGTSTDGTTPAPTATVVPGGALNATSTSDPNVLISDTRSTTLNDPAQATDAATTAATPGRRRGTPSAAASGQQPGGASGGTDGGTNGGQASGGNSTFNGQGNGSFTRGNGNGASTNGTNSGANGGTGGNTPNSFASGLTTVQLDQSGLYLATLGGGLALIFGLGLYYIERRRTNFTASHSRGLLNAGAALFTLIAVLIIPIIPGQFSGTVSAAGSTPRAAPVVRRNLPSATPSETPTVTLAPTQLPSLTPTVTDTPLPLPTAISWIAMQPTATPTPVVQCTVTANNNLNLRGDPSTSKAPTGVVPTGTKLSVTGESADKQWYLVMFKGSDGSTLTGWVSAPLTTSATKCDAPVVQPKS